MASKDTREKILEAALALFRERGFGETTMREIAARAGVSTGLAYYYFESKDAIVLAFYQRTKDTLPELLESAHAHGKLGDRLRALIEAKFTHFQHDRRFLGALMAHAADPTNPLSPFSDASREVREYDWSHFARAIAETGTSVPKDLAPHLPKILWMYQMGLILFWTYDRSPHQRRSRDLLAASLKVVLALITLARLPLLKPARKSVLEILAIVEDASGAR
jgi:AcrR family transcriptional regulator